MTLKNILLYPLLVIMNLIGLVILNVIAITLIIFEPEYIDDLIKDTIKVNKNN